MTLIFLDTETTGLDPDRHEIWELGFAIDDGPIKSACVPHSLRHADPIALRVNNYFERTAYGYLNGMKYGSELEEELRLHMPGATIVAANPHHDASFLGARWGYTPWHHRLWDIEAYAAGVLDLTELVGLRGLADAVRALGHNIPEPDHTAGGDVATLRATFHALQYIRSS